MADVEIVEQFEGFEKRWPGREKHVFHWCLLRTGHAAGWNENPARGGLNWRSSRAGPAR
jgi:hypothetical protein